MIDLSTDQGWQLATDYATRLGTMRGVLASVITAYDHGSPEHVHQAIESARVALTADRGADDE